MSFLQDITWTQFLTYLTGAFIIYYGAAIGVLIKAWWNNARTAAGKKVVWQPKVQEIHSIIAEPPIDSSPVSTDEIRSMEPDNKETNTSLLVALAWDNSYTRHSSKFQMNGVHFFCASYVPASR
jgi:hypothetical protein